MKRKRNNKKKKRGFSLFELLAVMVIMGIIMIIAVPSISAVILNSKKKAFVSSCKQLIDNARIRDAEAGNDKGNYYIDLKDLSENGDVISPINKKSIKGGLVYLKETSKGVSAGYHVYASDGEYSTIPKQGITKSSGVDSITKSDGLGDFNVDTVKTLIGTSLFDKTHNSLEEVKKMPHLVNAFTYNEAGSTHYNGDYSYSYTKSSSDCITGNEDACVETDCFENLNAGSCKNGTILKYLVNDNEEKTFYVLHDDGETITAQLSENVAESSWNGSTSDNKFLGNGPEIALALIKDKTSSWTYVNHLNFTIGEDTIYKKRKVACSYFSIECFDKTDDAGLLEFKYTYSGNARMITFLEAHENGCIHHSVGPFNDSSHCPIYMTINAAGNYYAGNGVGKGYWMQSIVNSYTISVYFVSSNGYYWSGSPHGVKGLRPVVVLRKNK